MSKMLKKVTTGALVFAGGGVLASSDVVNAETRREIIKHGTDIVNDPNLPKGERKKVKDGVDGEKEITIKEIHGTVTEHKPIDLLLIWDGSISFDRLIDKSLGDIKTLLSKLSDDDTVQFSFYDENTENSYTSLYSSTISSKEYPHYSFTTIKMKPSVALRIINDIISVRSSDEIVFNNITQYFVNRSRVLGLLSEPALQYSNNDSLRDKNGRVFSFFGGDSSIGKPFEEIYARDTRSNTTKAIIQFTDNWASDEKIDTSIVEWAKKNVKTFMSVVYRISEDEPLYSANSMRAAGHPNVYVPGYGASDEDRQSKLIKTIEETALESKDVVTGSSRTEKIIRDVVNEVIHVGTGEITTKKNDAIDAIKREAETKKGQINSANISEADKKTLIAKVEGEKDKGISAVNGADTIDKVETEKNRAIGLIRAISLTEAINNKANADLGVARNSAIDMIKKAAEDKLAEINKTDLLPEAKSRLIKQVEDEKNKGIEAVGKATNLTTVNSERDKAVNAIKAISLDADKKAKETKDLQDAKNSAIDMIKKAAEDKLAEIEKANILPEAKLRLKTQVEVERNKGISAVSNAGNVAIVSSERDKAITAIRGIGYDADVRNKIAVDKENEINNAKRDAINEINKVAQDKKSEIGKADISAEDKTRLKSEVDRLRDKGIAEVNKLTQVPEINNKKDQVIKAIKSTDLGSALKSKADKDLSSAKNKAIEDIKRAAEVKLREIDNANISPEAKARLRAGVEGEKNKGIDAVGKATDTNTVNAERDRAIRAINAISLDADKASKELKDAKDRSIVAIINAANKKSNEIGRADVLPETKIKLRAQVDAEKNKGIDAVNRANTVEGAKLESDKAVKIIESIVIEDDPRIKQELALKDAKIKAIEAIKKSVDSKNKEIDTANLTPEARERLKAEVEAEKSKGIDGVKGSHDVARVGAERDKAIKAIESINLDKDKREKAELDLKDAKRLGIDAIEKAARDKNKEIDDADLLSEAKDRLHKQVEAEKTKGIEAMNKATTVLNAKFESDKAVGVIRAISLDADKKAKQDLDEVRRTAIKAVRDKGEELLKDLEKRNLDPKEKSRLREKINEIVDTAVKNIGVANRDQIDPIKNKAIKDLEALIPEIKKLEQDKINRDNEELAKKNLDELKADVKKKVTDEYNRIKGEIEKSDLDDATKKELLKRLEDLYRKGLGDIDKATKDDILKIRDAIISDMNKVLDDANSKLRAKKEKEQLDLDKQKAKEKIKVEYEKQQNRIKGTNIPAKLKAELLRELLDRYSKGIRDIDAGDRNGLGKVTDDIIRDLIRIGDKAGIFEKEEADRLAREKGEAERLAREKEEADRLAREKAERERLDQERLEREKAERERLEREKRERERLEREKAERERAERERLERERLARENAERLAALEADRLAREKAEIERIAREVREKRERELAERNRLDHEKYLKDRLVREEAERLAREKAEHERLASEKTEQELLAREKAERERLERERLKRERLEREEAERLARFNSKATASQSAKKLPDTGSDNATYTGLLAVILGLLLRLKRKNKN